MMFYSKNFVAIMFERFVINYNLIVSIMLGSGKDPKAAQANKNDYELFLQAFQKPTQIYKLLGYRHCVNVSLGLFVFINSDYLLFIYFNC